MKLIALTVAYCPAAQLSRCLFEYQKNRLLKPDKHIVVLGHYPINTKKNNRDIRMIVESYGEAEILDPGSNIGSAQSQWWALTQLQLPDDAFWMNIDPDSACRDRGWDYAALKVLEAESQCVVVSCRSPLVEDLMKKRDQTFKIKELSTSGNSILYGLIDRPTPFNLSMWRYSFFKHIGGIPQVGEHWGEVEAGVIAYANHHNKFNAYLLDYLEDESGKFMQDKQLVEWKDLSMRTAAPNNFIGHYIEYLRSKHLQLSEIDTFIPEETIFK